MTLSIRIDEVSKLYRLGQVGTGSLTQDLNVWWHRIRGKGNPYELVGQENDRTGGESKGFVWALKNVGFEVSQGEIVGIIGKNGAGKSTLLKLLSRVTLPTQGMIKTKGRVASLLEVGTGFHPELTGRENVYLNGSILGMSKREITRELDAVVDFSGCSKYIDTPVKRYSSGMLVRLGFAVAAHLRCDILVVDEVLAVGDAAFRMKCIGKMRELSGDSARTVLIVSHQLGVIKSLCNRVVTMDRGTVKSVKATEEAVSEYVRDVRSGFLGTECSLENSWIRLTSVELQDRERSSVEWHTGDEMRIRFDYQSLRETPSPAFVIQIEDDCGYELFRFSTSPISGVPLGKLHPRGSVELRISELPLVAGEYSITIGLVAEQTEWLARFENAVRFEIQPTDYYDAGFCMRPGQGKVVAKHAWNHLEC